MKTHSERITVLSDWSWHPGEGPGPFEALWADIQHATAQAATPPERIICASVAEAAVLLCPEARRFLRRLRSAFPMAELSLVSQGCLGLYAGLLEQARTECRSALIVVIESPRALTQLVLDAAGIGGADGFRAEPSVGAALALRVSGNDHDGIGLVVADCAILSQEVSLLGAPRLARRVVAALKDLLATRALPVVSFQVHAPWAREMVRAIGELASPRLHPREWLPSVEVDRQHLLSVKPLVELARYRHVAAAGGLVLMTAGAGGRLGMMRLLPRPDANVQPFASMVSRERCSAEQQVAAIAWARAALGEDANADAAMERIGRELQFMKRCFRGVDNQIFCFDLGELI